MQAGANWNKGVHAGPRTVTVNNYPWNVNTNIGSRLACENQLNDDRHYGACRSDRLSDHYSLPQGKTMLAPRLRAGHSFFYQGGVSRVRAGIRLP